MKGSDEELARARTAALVARARLAQTMGEIQHRLSPRVLMREAWDEVREQGSDLADEALTVARERPAAVVAVVGAVVVLLVRQPLWRFVAGLFLATGETRNRSDGSGEMIEEKA